MKNSGTRLAYETAPTTGRAAEKITHLHGFETVQAYAESLSANAHIVDLGSGTSSFGREVAKFRQDVQVDCVDLNYSNPVLLEEVSIGKPSNVRYIAADVTKLNELYEPGSIDQVTSYWLLPHLSIDDPAPAIAASKEVYEVLKDGGSAIVGPRLGNEDLPYSERKKSLTITKTPDMNADTFSQRLLAETQMTGVLRYGNKMVNEVRDEVFGTSFISKRENDIPRMYDSKRGEFVSTRSWKGVKLGIATLAATARYMVRNNPLEEPGLAEEVRDIAVARGRKLTPIVAGLAVGVVAGRYTRMQGRKSRGAGTASF